MPPPEPETTSQLTATPPSAPQDFPDTIARSEHGVVATTVDSGTDRRVKRAAFMLGALLALGFVATTVVRWVHSHNVNQAAELAASTPPPVDVVIAKAAVGGQGLTLPGQTAAWYESTIYARVNGYVRQWSADIGDRVKQGQVLATIETPELDAELAGARAQLKASEAQVNARASEVEFAQSTNERWRDSPKGVVSDQEREAKRADFETASARLYAAQAQVALNHAKVQQYVALTQFKNVTAPFDGTVTERKIDVGNLVTAGSTSATSPLYHVSQSDPLRVFVDVPQSLADELRQPNLQAMVSTLDGAGRQATGLVARVAGAINPQARTMRVEVDIPNTNGAWVPGMYTRVSFQLAARGGVEVPAAALLFRTDGPQVARVGATGHVEFIPVTIVRDNGSLVELASAVHPGDRLVLNISSQISAGAAVTVTNDESKATPAPGARH